MRTIYQTFVRTILKNLRSGATIEFAGCANRIEPDVHRNQQVFRIIIIQRQHASKIRNMFRIYLSGGLAIVQEASSLNLYSMYRVSGSLRVKGDMAIELVMSLNCSNLIFSS